MRCSFAISAVGNAATVTLLPNAAGRRRWSAREAVEKFKFVYSVIYSPKQSEFLEITLKSRTGGILLSAGDNYY